MTQQPGDDQFGSQQFDNGRSGQPGQGAPEPTGDAWSVPPAQSSPAPYGQPSPAPYGQPSPAQYGEAPGQAPNQGWQPVAQKSEGANFFRALFDFKFEHFVTVKFSSVLYIVAIAVAALIWLGEIISSIFFGVIFGVASSGFLGDPTFNPVPLIFAILFGWIPAVISLIFMRVGLEFSVAVVRTALNTREIADASAPKA